MKYVKILSLFSLWIVVSCGNQTVPTDLAIQAMERARAAEADIYAPEEYTTAETLFNQMKDAMDRGNNNSATELAHAVVEAANKATEIARQNKATTLIARLKQNLNIAQEIGVDVDNPEIYAQATQLLIDAENFYSIPDYEKAIQAAQSGLDLLEPLVGGLQSLALANLNRARELLSRAYKTTDLSQTRSTLDEISTLVEQAAGEYQDQNYADSIKSSQKAIDWLNELIAQYPSDSAISIAVDDNENLQLQAYELIRRLGEVIKQIKEIEASSPSMEEEEMPEEDTEFFMESDDEELTDVEHFFYEEEPISYLPQTIKAQNTARLMSSRENSNNSSTNITVEMIEGYYGSAQRSYDQANYLDAIDQAREGLRLAELYLANKTLTTHKVIKGDTLWDISRSIYRTPWLWPNIWRANKLQIKDPDLIYPNQEFRIPPAPSQN